MKSLFLRSPARMENRIRAAASLSEGNQPSTQGCISCEASLKIRPHWCSRRRSCRLTTRNAGSSFLAVGMAPGWLPIGWGNPAVFSQAVRLPAISFCSRVLVIPKRPNGSTISPLPRSGRFLLPDNQEKMMPIYQNPVRLGAFSARVRSVIGKDDSGRWIAIDQDDRSGTPFSNRAAAVHFAVYESNLQPNAVFCLPEGQVVKPVSNHVGYHRKQRAADRSWSSRAG